MGSATSKKTIPEPPSTVRLQNRNRYCTEEEVRRIVSELVSPEQIATSLGDEFLASKVYGRCCVCEKITADRTDALENSSK